MWIWSLLPLCGLITVLVWAGWLYIRQDALVFRPSPPLAESPADLGLPFEDLYLHCTDGTAVHGWWVPGDECGKVVLFFHGSDGDITHELAPLSFLHSLGASVMIADYPGYGRSEGRPSERGCYAAAEASWSFVRETKNVRAEDVILFGFSLGGAVATHLAASRTCGGMAIQSSFTSVPDMAALTFPYLPVRIFCRTRMNSLERIARCGCPVLVLHSRADEHIPITQAYRIYARARGPKKLVPLQGSHFGHNWRHVRDVRAAWKELLSGQLDEWDRDTTRGGMQRDARRSQNDGVNSERISG